MGKTHRSAAAGPSSKRSSRAAATLKNERITRSSRAKHSYSLDDPEQVERDLNQQLKRMGLYAANTTGDGNCLFRALSDQLYGYSERHSQLRQETCDHLAARAEKFAGFVDDKPFDEYVRLMREPGTYAGHLELHAFAQMKQKQIKIVQPGLVYVVEGDDDSPEAIRKREEKEKERLRIQNTIEPGTDVGPNTDRQRRRQKREETKKKKKTAAELLASGQTIVSTSTESSDAAAPSKAEPSTFPTAVSSATDLAEAYGTLYIAYHNWEHYSSIRNLDGPHSGLPRIKERSMAAEQEEVEADVDSDQPNASVEPTVEEKMVMQSTSGGHDLQEVRRLLKVHHNDWAHVVELLVEKDTIIDEEKVGAELQAVSSPSQAESDKTMSSSAERCGPPTSLPDHMRRWRAASPSSVDTSATHSSGEGESPSTTATTEDGNDTACASPDTLSLSRGSTPGAEKMSSKRAASSDPMGMSFIRSPKRRSQSRSPGVETATADSESSSRSKLTEEADRRDIVLAPSSDPTDLLEEPREAYEIVKRGRGRPRKDGLPNKSSIAVKRRTPTVREKRDAAQARKRERQLERVVRSRAATVGDPKKAATSNKPSPAEVCGFRELKI